MVACSLGFFTPFANAQNTDSDDIEVYLDFRHRGVINSVVISYYKNNEFYLPISELFSLLQIDYDPSGLTGKGRFGLDQVDYRIDLNKNYILYGDKIYDISRDEYILKELDNYLRIDLFNKVFDLDFSVNFNNLTLQLETNTEIPAVAKAIRQQKRELANFNKGETVQYELRYKRERPFLDGGFVDYNLTSNLNSTINTYNANFNVGLQVYGGDLQGSISGSYSDNYTNFNTNNLRWQYKYLNQRWLTQLMIGQTNSDGISRNSYTGIRLSNEPVESRRLFDEFEIQGMTLPQSEVELYMNNALVDFQQSDALGNYRFLTPITYGTSKLDLRIYGPTGQIIEKQRRIQVPFTFQPQGVFNYAINAGQLDNPILGSTEQEMMAQANGAFGITNWLTAKAGVEYIDGYHDKTPTYSASLSSRILSNYILTMEAVSNAYYRSMLNVIYTNSASINIDYTHFNEGFGLYNPSSDDQRITASAYYPFNIFGLPLNLRASAFTRLRNTLNTSTYRLDASSKIGKVNVRVGYSDRSTGKFDPFNPSSLSYLESSFTYNISQNRSIPAYLRGYFLRAQFSYQPVQNKFESVELLASRNIFSTGRFQIAYGKNFLTDFNSFRFSFIIDFDKIRSGSTYNNIKGVHNYTQNVRGSIGYDTNYHNMILTNRDQVGRAGTAFKLFVDNNGNNTFDEGDDPIEGNAIRLLSSGASSTQKDGVLYFTQMRPYYFYNIELNKSEIKNPMLVPEFDQFGLVTDPNRFKKVEVPFYMSGVFEGIVERANEDDERSAVAGLKLFLTDLDREKTKELRTFSDGSFYDYEMPPGDYELRIDPSQLDLLNSRSIPEIIEFEVEAKPEGDFIEGLSFLLVPQEADSVPVQDELINIGVTETENRGGGLSFEFNIAVDSLAENRCHYGLQLGSYSSAAAAEMYIKQVKAGLSQSATIVFNELGKLYSVRSGDYSNLGSASEAARKVLSNLPNAVVVDQCYGTFNDFVPVTGDQYEIQFAAFSNPNRASTYQSELLKQYQLETFKIQDPSNGFYKVRTGPYTNKQEANNQISQIKRKTGIKDLYLVREKAKSSIPKINADYEYFLNFGEFADSRKAALYSLRLEEYFGIKSKILVDETDRINLVSENVYTQWNQIVSDRARIVNDPTFYTPVIHLVEFKP